MKNLTLIILLFITFTGFSQKEIMGIIQDENNNPMAGVQITEVVNWNYSTAEEVLNIEPGMSNSVYTDKNGAFQIKLIKKHTTELIILAPDLPTLNLYLSMDQEMEKQMIESNGAFITTVNLKLIYDTSLTYEAEIGFKPKNPSQNHLHQDWSGPAPANYEVVKEQHLIKPATTVQFIVPAKYETITKQVIKTPASARTISSAGGETRIEQVPSRYETVAEQVEVEPASTRTVQIPAKYETRTVIRPISPASTPDPQENSTAPDLSDYTRKSEVTVSSMQVVALTSSRSRKKETTVSNSIGNTKVKRKKTPKKQNDIVIVGKKTTGIKRKQLVSPKKKTPAVKKKKTRSTASVAKQTPTPPPAKILTATEVNDFSKWKFWEDITMNQLKEYTTTWNINTKQRYCVLVKKENDSPLIGGLVHLLDKNNEIIWTARTDNTGKAELWGSFFQPQLDGHQIQVVVDGTSHYKKRINTFHNGINVIQLPIACKEVKKAIDIAFVVDATASMGDELKYVKGEMLSIVRQSKKALPDYSIQLGSVFYYDEDTPGELMYTKDFTPDAQEMNQFIYQRNIKVGSNFPEALDHGMQQAMSLNWRDGATTKLLFLILDAPPHSGPEYYNRFKAAIQIAASKGIRIIPVGCSGTNKTTEYLMRAIALATNGTYVHLTDDSGVGKAHSRPTVEKINKESLNQILIRQITKFSKIEDCQPDIATLDSNQETTEKKTPFRKTDWSIYPNPTAGDLQIKTSKPISWIHVFDNNGKLLKRVLPTDRKSTRINIGELPPAVYLVRAVFEDGTQKTGKVVLINR